MRKQSGPLFPRGHGREQLIRAKPRAGANPCAAQTRCTPHRPRRAPARNNIQRALGHNAGPPGSDCRPSARSDRQPQAGHELREGGPWAARPGSGATATVAAAVTSPGTALGHAMAVVRGTCGARWQHGPARAVQSSNSSRSGCGRDPPGRGGSFGTIRVRFPAGWSGSSPGFRR